MVAAAPQTISLPVQFRYATIAAPAAQSGSAIVDPETREATFSFSSESPVQRINWDIWEYIYEVLSHDPAHANLDRCNSNAAPLLWNHNRDDQRGVVTKAWIDSDRRAYATVRFSKSAAGDQLMQDVNDRIISNVSFGYRNYELQLTTQREGDYNTYTSLDWEVLEISLCSIPADATVGVGRSIENTNPVIIRGLTMPENLDPTPTTSNTAELEQLRRDLETTQLQLAQTQKREQLTSRFNTLKETGRTLLDERKLSTAEYEKLFSATALTRYLENEPELTGVEFHLKQLKDFAIASKSFAPAIAGSDIPDHPNERGEADTAKADAFLETHKPRRLY